MAKKEKVVREDGSEWYLERDPEDIPTKEVGMKNVETSDMEMLEELMPRRGKKKGK